MKKCILVSLVVISTLGVDVPAFAQQGIGESPKTTSRIRVARVNFNMVFAKYEAAKDFQLELQESLKPLISKADQIDYDSYGGWTGNHSVSMTKWLIDWDNLRREMGQFVEKNHEKKIRRLRQEIGSAVRSVAAKRGYEMVLSDGFPEILPEKVLTRFPSPSDHDYERPVGGVLFMIDQGRIPDITDEVAKKLHDWTAEMRRPFPNRKFQ